MLKFANEVKESVKVLKDAIVCGNGPNHSNEQKWLNCLECRPFININDGNMFQEDNYPSNEAECDESEEEEED